MKTLYIVRHAKSSWAAEGIRDFERPLKNTGIERTKKVASFLVSRKIKPDLIISSHAIRAYETSKIIAIEMGYPLEAIVIDENIYYGRKANILDIIYGIPDEISSCMIFGHNPTFTELANAFLEEKIPYLPTTGVVAIQFETHSWSEVLSVPRSTLFFISPKMIKPTDAE